jgi:RNA polymerase sigma-70 factor, ECF subfamily
MGVLQTCRPDWVGPLQPAGYQRKVVAPSAGIDEWAAVQRAVAGDAEAQEHLFERHIGRLYRTAFALLHNKEDAEDAVQDGLCQAYIGLSSFQGRCSFSTWLMSIVMNSARMTRRKKSRRQEASLDEILENSSQALPKAFFCGSSDPETTCAAIEIAALVERQFNLLRPTLKTTFRLRTVNGFSGPELAQALGISLNAVKSRLLRARRTLSRGLRPCLKGRECPSRGSAN